MFSFPIYIFSSLFHFLKTNRNVSDSRLLVKLDYTRENRDARQEDHGPYEIVSSSINNGKKEFASLVRARLDRLIASLSLVRIVIIYINKLDKAPFRW